MNHEVAGVLLRSPESRDAAALYAQKNDVEVASLLGGFSKGYSETDIAGWIEAHRGRADEALFVIADGATNACLGHVGLYNIDHRIRSAEFAIMIGDKDAWGRGLGTEITAYMLDYGFGWLNLNRIELTVLSSNARAIALYEKLGFSGEGVKRQAQYKSGRYVDVYLMAKLREDLDVDDS
jgi:RimJ/RimL family protein N-acetyltransferase